MLATITHAIRDLWQQPAMINLAYALPWLLIVVIVSVVCLPIPIETLMLTSLTLAKHWHYSLPTLLGVFILGTVIGLHIGYGFGIWLEHLIEPWLLRKYKITPEQWQLKLQHFKRYDMVILVFGLFVPGLRHTVGILAGATRMSYTTFAPLALLGASCWVLTFTFIGWLVG